MEKFISIAIHTEKKARILRDVLNEEGLEVSLENIGSPSDSKTIGTQVRVKLIDLPKALKIVESRNLFSYSDKDALMYDDSRKRILVPVDFSEYSMRACEFAFNLAKDIDAKIKIIHIYFNPFYPDTFADRQNGKKEYENIEEKVKENIRRLCHEIDSMIASGKYPSVNYSYFIKEGLPDEIIVSFADDYKPELIIMGTRGKGAKDGDLMGSITADIIEMSRFPVIAIPNLASFSNFREISKVVFLTNFSQRDLVAFERMVHMLSPYDISYDIIHISTEKNERWDSLKLQEVESYFYTKYSELGLSIKQLEVDNFLDGLDAYIKNAKVGVLALTTSKRNIFMRMFRPSISRKMLYHSNVPLFILRG